MKKTLHLEILDPEHQVYSGDVHMVIVRATTGEMGVLPGHAPLVALLDVKPVRVIRDEGELLLNVAGGVMLVKPEGVTILTS